MAKLTPTADTWVMRGESTPGDPPAFVPVKVAEMTDGHLTRWVYYFRRKVRETNDLFHQVQGAAYDAVIDRYLKSTMVTAPAIFAEITKRGLYLEPSDRVTLPSPPGKTTSFAVANKLPVGFAALLTKALSDLGSATANSTAGFEKLQDALAQHMEDVEATADGGRCRCGCGLTRGEIARRHQSLSDSRRHNFDTPAGAGAHHALPLDPPEPVPGVRLITLEDD